MVRAWERKASGAASERGCASPGRDTSSEWGRPQARATGYLSLSKDKARRWCETSSRQDNDGLELVAVTGNLANFNSVRGCLGSFDSRLS